jgi:hypothetical protein
MALNAKKAGNGGNKNITPQANIEPGVYPARLVQLIDLGLQPQKPYQGKDKAPVQEIMLTYELVDTFMKDEGGNDLEDKPRWISETLPFYGLFADKAKSTQRYLAFDPQEEFDGEFAKAIGMPINVAVVNNQVGEKIYDNIATVSSMRPRDAAKCPELVNPSKVFDLDAPDMAVFSALPKWVQDKIKGNLTFNGSVLEKALGGNPAKAAEKATKVAPKEPTPDADAADDDTPY